ncbi:hypothetical protein LUZ60_009816 [Juncus effusus]|nr:hypothetical protein LUZ60_009816 [Juncus effusus]
MKRGASNYIDNGGENKLERKDQEKRRREHMKKLCHELSSLVPKQHLTNSSKDVMTQQDSLDEAASYITYLKQRVEILKESRNSEQNFRSQNNNNNKTTTKLPIVEVRSEDKNLEVILISSLQKKFKFHQVISIMEEEGAEVINASMSSINDKVFYTIHSRAFSSRIGLEASKVLDRLRNLVP